jgi:hypothetical protein
VLLEDIPAAEGDPILRGCLLFQHHGWHLHPILRDVARHPGADLSDKALPLNIVRDAGLRMVGYFRSEAKTHLAAGDIEGGAAAQASALDACAMAESHSLAEGLAGDLPDPYDHIGSSASHDPARSRAAFGVARGIDASDATAIRGLADAEDRAAVNAAEVELLFRRAVELEPSDPDTHVRLIGVLLASGRPQAAIEAFVDATVLAVAPSEQALVERLFKPVVELAIAGGNLPLASRASIAARETSGAAAIEQIDQLVEGLIEALEYGEFVSQSRLGTEWWPEPELLAAFDEERHALSRWLAARVDSVDGEEVALHYADVELPSEPGVRPPRAWTTMSTSTLGELSVDQLPPDLPGTILEIGIYGDGEHAGSTLIRVVRNSDLTLTDPSLPVDRYVHQT